MVNGLDIAGARRIVLESVEALGAEEVAVDDALGRVLAETLESAGPLPPFDSSAMDGLRGDRRRRSRAAGHGGVACRATGGQGASARRGDRDLHRRRGAGRTRTWPWCRWSGSSAWATRWYAYPIPRRAPTCGERARTPAPVRSWSPPEACSARRSWPCPHRSGGRTCGAARGRALPCSSPATSWSKPAGRSAPGRSATRTRWRSRRRRSRPGAEVVERQIVRDDLEATVAALEPALDQVDVVCVSGGVSVGAARPREAGARRARRGGAVLGRAAEARQADLVRSAPRGARVRPAGQPGLGDGDVSPVRPPRAARARRERTRRRREPARGSTRRVERHPHRDQALRCRLHAEDDGWHVQPTKEQGSHVLTSMVGAAALALVPAGLGELSAGDRVDVELLPSW